MEPLMFKRDIRKVYRTIPISVKGFEFAHVCFAFEGHYWACRQLGMFFCCVAAVLSFHRLGNLLEEFARKKFMAAIARYVDDFFGCKGWSANARRQGVVTDGCLDGHLLRRSKECR